MYPSLGTPCLGAGKFLGVRRIFARISPNLSEKHLDHFLCEHFLKQNFFWDDLQKKRSSYDSADVMHHFFKSNHVGRHFCPDIAKVSDILPRFPWIFPGFSGILPDFHQIKTFGGPLSPPAPRLLHHWNYQLAWCYEVFTPKRNALDFKHPSQ